MQFIDIIKFMTECFNIKIFQEMDFFNMSINMKVYMYTTLKILILYIQNFDNQNYLLIFYTSYW